MISEYYELPFLSTEPERVSQMTEASEATSANVQLQTELELSANIRLQTEHANGKLNLITSADGLNERLWEEHMTTNLAHGPDGKSNASQSDVEISSWTASASKSISSYSKHLL